MRGSSFIFILSLSLTSASVPSHAAVVANQSLNESIMTRSSATLTLDQQAVLNLLASDQYNLGLYVPAGAYSLNAEHFSLELYEALQEALTTSKSSQVICSLLISTLDFSTSPKLQGQMQKGKTSQTQVEGLANGSASASGYSPEGASNTPCQTLATQMPSETEAMKYLAVSIALHNENLSSQGKPLIFDILMKVANIHYSAESKTALKPLFNLASMPACTKNFALKSTDLSINGRRLLDPALALIRELQADQNFFAADRATCLSILNSTNSQELQSSYIKMENAAPVGWPVLPTTRPPLNITYCHTLENFFGLPCTDAAGINYSSNASAMNLASGTAFSQITKFLKNFFPVTFLPTGKQAAFRTTPGGTQIIVRNQLWPNITSMPYTGQYINSGSNNTIVFSTVPSQVMQSLVSAGMPGATGFGSEAFYTSAHTTVIHELITVLLQRLAAQGQFLGDASFMSTVTGSLATVTHASAFWAEGVPMFMQLLMEGWDPAGDNSKFVLHSAPTKPLHFMGMDITALNQAMNRALNFGGQSASFKNAYGQGYPVHTSLGYKSANPTTATLPPLPASTTSLSWPPQYNSSNPPYGPQFNAAQLALNILTRMAMMIGVTNTLKIAYHAMSLTDLNLRPFTMTQIANTFVDAAQAVCSSCVRPVKIAFLSHGVYSTVGLAPSEYTWTAAANAVGLNFTPQATLRGTTASSLFTSLPTSNNVNPNCAINVFNAFPDRVTGGAALYNIVSFRNPSEMNDFYSFDFRATGTVSTGIPNMDGPLLARLPGGFPLTGTSIILPGQANNSYDFAFYRKLSCPNPAEANMSQWNVESLGFAFNLKANGIALKLTRNSETTSSINVTGEIIDPLNTVYGQGPFTYSTQIVFQGGTSTTLTGSSFTLTLPKNSYLSMTASRTSGPSTATVIETASNEIGVRDFAVDGGLGLNVTIPPVKAHPLRGGMAYLNSLQLGGGSSGMGMPDKVNPIPNEDPNAPESPNKPAGDQGESSFQEGSPKYNLAEP